MKKIAVLLLSLLLCSPAFPFGISRGGIGITRRAGNFHWKAPVNSQSDLPSTASLGDARVVEDEDAVYHYDGSSWNKLQASMYLFGLYSRVSTDLWALKGTTVAADRYTIQTPTRLSIDIDDTVYFLTAQADIDLSNSANWDATSPTDYTVAANRAGVDFYIYACQPTSGDTPDFVLSANSTTPSGYTTADSRKIGGFHCLCVDVGSISGHDLDGFVAGDVLPASIWDLEHRPTCSPEGMVYSEDANIWVDIYLASGTGASTASAYHGTISDNRNWMDFVDDGGAVGKRMLKDREFQLIAAGSNEKTNIAGSADPNTTGGHIDTASRRMISNIGCEDCAGVMWQWLDEQSYRLDGVFQVVAAGKTNTVTYDASPGGNQIYLKFDNGTPYLCCNMATDTADKVLTFSTDYKVTIVHDASAATGGLPIYFDDNASQPSRLLVNNTILSKDCYIQSNNPQYPLKVKHDASAATNGTALYYDDGADERLESVNAGTANASIDLANANAPSWNWYNLPGNKGSLNKQGTYGDVKSVAGAYWANGSGSGSRARGAYGSRWDTWATSGCRFASEPSK